MGPFRGAREPQEICEVNVVPLADVSLVLLIILLVLSPMMAQHRLQVQAAAEKSGAAAAEPEAEPAKAPPDWVVVVGLSPDRVTVGERVFTGNAGLVSYLAGMLLLRSDRKVFLAPQPEVAHGRVVETIELLKSAGATSVALVQSAPEATPVP